MLARIPAAVRLVAVSPLAAESLIDAVTRTRVREDRVTEVLASYLRYDDAGRRAFCGEVKAPPLTSAAVLTQRMIPRVAGRIDCELRLTENSQLHVVWIEVKVDQTTEEQPEQLSRYARELQRLYGDDSTLVALAPDRHEIFRSAEAPLIIEGRAVAERTAIALTWAQLGQALERLGSEWGGRRWRARARRAHEPSGRRALVDVLSYFERNKLMQPDDPITSSDAHVVHRGAELLADKAGAVARLLDIAAARITGLDAKDADSWWGAMTQARYVSWAEGWPPEVNGGGGTYFQFGLAPSDATEREEHRDEPVFFAGLSFEPTMPDAFELLRHPAWVGTSGFWVHEWGRHNVVARKILYVAELALSEITLSGQAVVLADWADQIIAEIRALPDPRASSAG